MGVRLYSPVLGRFLQTDPVPGGSRNAYDYAGQDPINTFDLDGRCFVVCSLASGIGIAGAEGFAAADWWNPAGWAVAGGLAIYGGYKSYQWYTEDHEHTKGKRPSTEGKHQKGRARKKQDGGGERGDARRRNKGVNPNKHGNPKPPKRRYFRDE
jgi:hypothetical protein